MAETRKAYKRRQALGWFDAYCKGRGIDIGPGTDPLVSTATWLTCELFDKEQGDAQTMIRRDGTPVERGVYDYVYASHILEHLPNPTLAVECWLSLLKADGYLIICVPHRDLYEKRKRLPSLWNEEHKHFWVPLDHEEPDTIGMQQFLRQWELPYVVTICDEGWEPVAENVHSHGEYQIEVVIKNGRWEL